MANQYSNNSLKAVIESKYNLPLNEVLYNFQAQGKSYKEVCQETGFKETTVRKYTRRCGYTLNTKLDQEPYNAQAAMSSIYSQLRSQELNRINVLSRSWSHKRKVL
jgi:hypothetical protein